MDIIAFLEDWIAVCNRYDTIQYLDKYHADAVLDDPSVGKKFVRHKGIRSYFKDYFIGYRTQTRMVDAKITGQDRAFLTVEFTGNFPGGQVGGTFDLTFRDGKIGFVVADLC
jgi:ketosteroid isomerase-like protein